MDQNQCPSKYIPNWYKGKKAKKAKKQKSKKAKKANMYNMCYVRSRDNYIATTYMSEIRNNTARKFSWAGLGSPKAETQCQA